MTSSTDARGGSSWLWVLAALLVACSYRPLPIAGDRAGTSGGASGSGGLSSASGGSGAGGSGGSGIGGSGIGGSRGCAAVCAVEQICRADTCQPRITEFALPPPVGAGPYGITTGPDGALWFTEYNRAAIGRITIDGQITEYALLPTALPTSITTGPDGNLWFTESGTDDIGRITRDGTMLRPFFSVAGSGQVSGPTTIINGPDGNLWFTESQSSRIGRITPDGVVVERSPTTPGSRPAGLAVGIDGNLWFAEPGVSQIAWVTTQGVFRELQPSPPLTGNDVAAGPDGSLWFVGSSTMGMGGVLRVTPGGTVAHFPTLSPAARLPWAITAGPDGNLWFTYYFVTDRVARIGRVTPDGRFTDFMLNPPPAPPRSATLSTMGITAGPDGNIWFTELADGRIGRLDPR